MTKKILIIIIVIVSSTLAKAQLANTSWKGKFYIPDPTEMILQFKADTVLLNFSYGSTLESMTYKISNDTLTIRKLDGQSDCSVTDEATYKIEIKDKKLSVKPLSDNCINRANAWPTEALEQVESGS